MAANALRLAVVGCGPIARMGHIPAARQVAGVELVALVDGDRERARSMAARFRVTRAVGALSEVAGAVDAAILAAPPQEQPALAEEAFAAGLHVLCEAPLASTADDCMRVLRAASRARRVLAVAHTCRFFPNRRHIHDLLQEGVLGQVRHVEAQQGARRPWPLWPGQLFRQDLAPGGALLSPGIHLLDTLFWWLGSPTDANYEGDAAAGLESDARLRMAFAGGATAAIRLSHTCRLENRITVEGEAGSFSVAIDDQLRFTETRGGKTVTRRAAGGRPGMVRVVAEQLRDFAGSIAEQRPPCATGADGMRVVQFIERCYAAGQGAGGR